MQYYSKLFIMGFIMLLTGCSTAPKKEGTGLNPALNDKSFQNAFKDKTIKLVAPASGTPPAQIEALRALSELNIQIPDKLITDDIVFHSASDSERFKQLKAALYDKSKNTIVWCLRGGYGSARLLAKLKTLPVPKQEKTFIGFSDQTALHLFLSQHWHWKTIHGAGLKQILEENIDPQNFIRIGDIVAKRVASQRFTALIPLNRIAQKDKKITGSLTGGNLTLIENSLGTFWQINASQKILFIEDTGMKGYQVDRALHHLQQVGVFKRVKAILFGDFTDSPHPEHVMLALQRFAEEVNIPVYKCNLFGHDKVNYPLIYNAKANIQSTEVPDQYEMVMYLDKS